MIDWGKISKEDEALVIRICERVEARGTEKGYKRINLLMDIEAAHLSCPISLKSLLEADDVTFWHDVGGISRHINRETGELGGCFVPRTALGGDATAQP